MTTPLGRKIIDLIELNGPLSVADYFHLCLADPEHGYYQVEEPFGESGDFTTAPEISQLFGELIGIFFVQAWQAMNRPANLQCVELGPGRGTLMADIQRVMIALAPDLAGSASFHLVESSERLRAQQTQTLAGCGMQNFWHDDLATIPTGPTLLVANEFFDALPIRQFVKTPEGFRERVVTIDDHRQLALAAGLAELVAENPEIGAGLPDGTIFEQAPARTAYFERIAQRLSEFGGFALTIDYGHFQTNVGDTLQAVSGHGYEDVLHSPGKADLTSHVDFEALASVAKDHGVTVAAPLTQAQFLLRLGLLERAGSLGSGKSPQVQETIRNAVERLAGEGDGQMGKLFKVLCIFSGCGLIPPFESAD